ncbi:MAG: hypothetical protein M3362_10775 [Acidobacteriota bacterium]|nr:hypothetical protein [Acidobacteriota bacterium]
MDALELIIQQATTGRINRADAESVCATTGIEMTELYNQIALIVAKRFDAGSLSYEDGDGAMNAIFSMMADDDANGHPAPYVEPAWSIFLAFDEGEYFHGGSSDPVETFTRTQIRVILADAQQLIGPERK